MRLRTPATTATFVARAALAAATIQALASCGRLESPDLTTGSLAGRLTGASANAYVYPLGQPERRVFPASDGTWVLDGLPAGSMEVVLVDGAAGAWRAERLAAHVAGADVVRLPARLAASLPAAGRVAAVARFGGACEASSPRFTVVGTDQRDVAPVAAGSAALLERLPAGMYELAGRSGGFADASAAVTVTAGATLPFELLLGLGSTGTATRGCTAPGAGCRPGLVCDPADGACYECVGDADCAAPGTVCSNHVCHQPAVAETCDPCSKDSECESMGPGLPAVCASGGFCTHACNGASDCPAGFACVADGARTVCRAPQGCEEAREEFGGECFFDSSCQDDLFHGVCHGAAPGAEDPVPGYCTGACRRQDDCDLVPGFVCDTTLQLCVRR